MKRKLLLEGNTPQPLTKAPWVGTTSEGLWAPIILSEHAQCLVCRGMLSPGEQIMCSPGLWVRHPQCRWPRDARGVEDQAEVRVNATPRPNRGLN